VEVEMATKVTVALEDDLDGRPAVETVRFAVEGAEYEIDLNKKNVAAFGKKLAPFIEHARRAGRGPRRRGGRSAAGRERGERDPARPNPGVPLRLAVLERPIGYCVIAASIRARWVNACGKLPICSPVSAISSECSPRWLAPADLQGRSLRPVYTAGNTRSPPQPGEADNPDHVPSGTGKWPELERA
jgi:hypothetical protein